MPTLDPLLPALLIGALVVVLLAFTFGTQRNITRGNAILRWLQGALPRLGQRSTLRWLGSSVAELQLVDPAAPFREVTVLTVLEPRDIPLLWAFTRKRGRRDLLIFRTSLRRAPRIELEASDPAAWITAREPGEEPGWRSLAWSGDIRAVERGEPDAAMIEAARAAWTSLTSASGGVWRMSVRRTVPHLEVHVRPPDLAAVDSTPLIEAIRGLAVEMGR